MCSIHRGEARGLSMNLVGPKWVPGASADSWGVFWGDGQRKNKGSANAACLPRRHSLPRTPRGYHERSRTKPKSNLHLLLARHIWREHAFFLCFGVPPGFYCPCKHLCLDPVPERRGYLVGDLVSCMAGCGFAADAPAHAARPALSAHRRLGRSLPPTVRRLTLHEKRHCSHPFASPHCPALLGLKLLARSLQAYPAQCRRRHKCVAKCPKQSICVRCGHHSIKRVKSQRTRDSMTDNLPLSRA